jgi:DNA-binding phage protein
VLKVVVPVREEILRAAERRKARGVGEEVAQFLAELIDLGFEHRLQQLYRKFEAGELSLGYFANELGLSVRDLYAALEERGLPTSNIGARPSVTTNCTN